MPRRIKNRFDDEGIQFAFPQQVLHVENGTLPVSTVPETCPLSFCHNKAVLDISDVKAGNA